MKRKFKTESKRLLDLVTHSIYTNKEIFLRELISNASDAIDKYHHEHLTNDLPERDYKIEISVDEDQKTISISDNGIGMNVDELNDHLGTIAKSGTKAFAEANDTNESIGQFGVGFYSSFIVGDTVDVYTKSATSDTAYKWTSDGIENYTITEVDSDFEGTKIVIHLREDDEHYKYSRFLRTYEIENLVKTYSDYVRYPIHMEVEERDYSEDKEEPTIKQVDKVLNSMIPIWKRSKSSLTDEEINDFYKHKFLQFDDPLLHVHTQVEGRLTYHAMLFVPGKAPSNLHAKSYEKGLQLYSKGIFVKDKVAELVPEWMMFVQGVVDSADLNLNISRELVQESKTLMSIQEALEKKMKSELVKLQDDRDAYKVFWKEYGTYIKYGIYDKYGAKKELLEDLILVDTNKREGITLSEYLEELKEDQQEIYYATGKTKLQIEALPQMDALKANDYEVIYFMDDVDEFMIQIMGSFQEKEFKSVNHSNLDLSTDEEKKELEEKTKTSKNLIEGMKSALGDLVDDVVLSSRLTDSPLCIVSGDDLSFEMEKVLSQIPGQNVKAKRILELNPKHELFASIEAAYSKDSLSVGKYAKLLLLEAMLIEGLEIENPKEMVQSITSLIIENTK